MGLLSAAALLALAATPTAPAELSEAQARLLDGDVVSLTRARRQRALAGEDVDVGPWALLDDLSRLMRCLPLGPVPADLERVVRRRAAQVA